MPKLVFCDVPPGFHVRIRKILSPQLPPHLRKEVLYYFPDGFAEWADDENEAPKAHVEIKTSADTSCTDAFLLARLCAPHLDVELYLPNGRMIFYTKGEAVPETIVIIVAGQEALEISLNTSDYADVNAAIKKVAWALKDDIDICPVIDGQEQRLFTRPYRLPSVIA